MEWSILGEGRASVPNDPRRGHTGAKRGQSWLRLQERERHLVSGVTIAGHSRLAGERASRFNRFAFVGPGNSATRSNEHLQGHASIVRPLTERQ